MIVGNRPFLLFDYFRVPYEIRDDGADWGVLAGGTGSVVWPPAHELVPGLRALRWLDGVPLYAALAPADVLAERRRASGGTWTVLRTIRDRDGNAVAAIERNGDGTILLPFDPGDAMTSCWSEAYTGSARTPGLKRLAMGAYYALRPAMPRRVQLALRRAFSRIQARSSFPRWPVEAGLHDLYGVLFALLAAALGGPLPALAPWPRGRRWALVLTHDVEHRAGYDAIPVLRGIEERLGYRSAWYLVPERDYEVDDAVVEDLQQHGFEVGVHGLRHDARDLVPAVFRERRASITAWGERWRASGFRSPATHRDWQLMPELPFDYDTSSFDTDPFEPQSGGCCTWLPFENRRLVELPLTLTMDHTIFVILRRGSAVWEEKADLLRERGGMAMLLTHPDYMIDADRLDAYERFLRRYAGDDTAWRALPREVAEWWRRRAASSIRGDASAGYTVDGPAADEAEIVLLGRDDFAG